MRKVFAKDKSSHAHRSPRKSPDSPDKCSIVTACHRAHALHAKYSEGPLLPLNIHQVTANPSMIGVKAGRLLLLKCNIF